MKKDLARVTITLHVNTADNSHSHSFKHELLYQSEPRDLYQAETYSVDSFAKQLRSAVEFVDTHFARIRSRTDYKYYRENTNADNLRFGTTNKTLDLNPVSAQAIIDELRARFPSVY